MPSTGSQRHEQMEKESQMDCAPLLKRCSRDPSKTTDGFSASNSGFWWNTSFREGLLRFISNDGKGSYPGVRALQALPPHSDIGFLC